MNRKKIREVAWAVLPGMGFTVRIVQYNRYGKAYVDVARYNEYDIDICSGPEQKTIVYDIQDINGVRSPEGAKEAFETMAREVFGYDAPLTWHDHE